MKFLLFLSACQCKCRCRYLQDPHQVFIHNHIANWSIAKCESETGLLNNLRISQSVAKGKGTESRRKWYSGGGRFDSRSEYGLSWLSFVLRSVLRSKSFRANVGIEYRLGHFRFLGNPFHIHYSVAILPSDAVRATDMADSVIKMIISKLGGLKNELQNL
jgi:hypothetical protein